MIAVGAIVGIVGAVGVVVVLSRHCKVVVVFVVDAFICLSSQEPFGTV